MNENDLALWQQGLAQDDPALIARVAGSTLLGEQGTRLAQALATHPLPQHALAVLEDLGWFKEGWPLDVARTTLCHDWTAIFSWRYNHAGKIRANKEIMDAVDDGLRHLIWQRQSRPTNPTNLESMLLAGLARPGMVDLCRDFLDNVHPAVLFDLSSKEREHAWLAHSGLDVGRVCRAALEYRNYIERMNPGKDWTPGEIPYTPLERWLDLDPAYRQAWDACVAQDGAVAREFGRWLQQWMPGPWHTSALRDWCKEVLVQSPWEGPSPVEASFLAKSVANLGERAFAEALHFALEPRTRYTSDYDVLVNTINSARSQLESEEPPNRHISLAAPTVLWVGLRGSHPWIDDFIQSEQGALRVQQEMSQDFRITLAFGEWTGRRIAETILAQPVWQSWRDERGRNLLHVHWDLCAYDNKPPGERILMKLAKQAPGVLSEPDTQGRKLLDVLPMFSSTRKKLERALIAKHIVPVRRKATRARPRM